MVVSISSSPFVAIHLCWVIRPVVSVHLGLTASLWPVHSSVVRFSLFGCLVPVWLCLLFFWFDSVLPVSFSSVFAVVHAWCVLSCLSGVVYFSHRQCLFCICVSFSVLFGPLVLTDSGSGSDCLCVASSRHCEHCRFRSRAFSAHPAGLRSTHCVFLRSLLVGVSFRSCWHRFPSTRSFSVSFCVGSCSTHCVFLRSLLVGVFLVVSPNTLSCTHTRCC